MDMNFGMQVKFVGHGHRSKVWVTSSKNVSNGMSVRGSRLAGWACKGSDEEIPSRLRVYSKRLRSFLTMQSSTM